MTKRYNTVGDVLAAVQNVVEFFDVELRSVDQKGMFGSTPLLITMYWTERADARAAVKLLLEAGADVNAAGEYGETPLHCAASTGDLEMVKLLLEGGAKPEALDSEGKTPADLAAARGNLEVLNYIRSAVGLNR